MCKLTPEQRDQAASYYGYAIRTAERYRHLADFDELKSACSLAVCHAVRRYNPVKGRTLISYVVMWCRAACWKVISRASRKPTPGVRAPDACEMHRNTNYNTMGETFADQPQPLITDRDPPSLSQSITDLPTYRRMTAREREVIGVYCGSGCQRHAGQVLGVSSEYVRQVIARLVTESREELVTC